MGSKSNKFQEPTYLDFLTELESLGCEYELSLINSLPDPENGLLSLTATYKGQDVLGFVTSWFGPTDTGMSGLHGEVRPELTERIRRIDQEIVWKEPQSKVEEAV